MKKICGLFLQILAYLLAVCALAIPLSVLAFYWAGTQGEIEPGAVYLLAGALICLIVVYVWTKLPIQKARALWSFLFGAGVYAVLGYFAVFGFAKDTVSIFTPFDLTTGNDILCYVGAGMLLFGIVIAAQGRYLVRDAGKPRKEATPPKISAAETTLKPETVVPHTAALASAQVVGLQPIVAPMPYLPLDQSGSAAPSAALVTASSAKEEGEAQVFTPVDKKQIKYARDKWGNLIVYEKDRP